jgi:hypothetical protein
MSEFEQIILALVVNIENGRLTLERIEQIYHGAPEGLKDRVMQAVNLRLESRRMMESLSAN